jgi:hypothetical protein
MTEEGELGLLGARLEFAGKWTPGDWATHTYAEHTGPVR